MTQEQALDILKTGSNVYLTGCAGSGKTFVLHKYLLYLKTRGKSVGITASTGVAATQLGGMTIHSWSGLGLKENITDREIQDLLKRKYLNKRFEDTDVLLIDEVSMLSSHFIASLNKLCKAFKGRTASFGGMQIVLCGDFFQLPPIAKKGEETHFIYKSDVWEELDLAVCYLHKPYRQNDEKFLKLLTEIRTNSVTKDTWDTLKERFLDPVLPGMTPTRLFTHTENVDQINTEELAKIKTEVHEYDMESNGDEILAGVIKNNCLAPSKLILKKGALVMFVKNNYEAGYVNGSMGRVIRITEKEDYPVVRLFSGKEIIARPSLWELDDEEGKARATITQIPLRLAWAITIHKSQGMSLDAAEIDLGRSFVKGMGYVALSRVRTLQGLRLKSINPTALKVNEEVSAFDEELQRMSDDLVMQLQY